VARRLKSELKRLFAENGFKNAVVTVNTDIVDRIFASRYFSAVCENEWRDKRIYLSPDRKVKPLEFKITGNDETSMTLPVTSKLLY